MSDVETEEPVYAIVQQGQRWAWICDAADDCETGYGNNCPTKSYAHLEAQVHWHTEHS